MELVLTVMTYDGRRPAETWSARCVGETCVVGRHPGCHLELPDPECQISGRHALIERRGDGFSVTDISTNGTFLNDAATPLERSQTVDLHDGDRLHIGQYTIAVALVAAADASLPPTPAPWPGEASEPVPDARSTADILELIGATPDSAPPPQSAQARRAEPRPDAGTELRGPKGGSSTPDPADEATALAVGGEAGISPMTAGPAVHELPRAGDEPPHEPPHETQDSPQASPQDEPRSSPQAETSIAPRPDPDDRGRSAIASTDHGREAADDCRPRLGTGADHATRARAEVDEEPPGEASPRASELKAFLSGLGTGDPAEIRDPERVMRTSGELLRAMTQGLMASMMARASFKSELRLGVTTIKASDNNPFQFCADPEDALERLLWRPSRGFLEPATAARQAFDDVQTHQMALMAGLRGVLQALLARIEPHGIEQEADRGSGLDRLLPNARKARCWDLFVAAFDEIADDVAEDFMQLFGDAFNRAYDDQIERLSAAKRRH